PPEILGPPDLTGRPGPQIPPGQRHDRDVHDGDGGEDELVRLTFRCHSLSLMADRCDQSGIPGASAPYRPLGNSAAPALRAVNLSTSSTATMIAAKPSVCRRTSSAAGSTGWQVSPSWNWCSPLLGGLSEPTSTPPGRSTRSASARIWFCSAV